jgi:asparagine synthase (glutamine-hydrolysing)
MCGIAGGFWYRDRGDIDVRLRSSLACLRHRGPNDSGYEIVQEAARTIALGQTRLSIIDLSAGGHQPMLSADGRLAIVFNGEIYNYRELRAELRALDQTFRSESDTEVLLAAYAEWGAACLRRLVGMFAFVVHDRSRGRIFCARDAFGIKPFFYEWSDDGFLFASEQSALRALRDRPFGPDLQRSYDYLVHGDYDSQERSFLKGVLHLPPGTFLDMDLTSDDRAKPITWWRAPTDKTFERSFAEAAEAVREQFLQNVKLHLRSDVPLGMALSGGIDSSAVVCAVQHIAPEQPIYTFSYIADDHRISEDKWVDVVNEKVGAISRKVRVTAEELARDLDRMISIQGEPFGSTSVYAQYRVFQLAKENGVTVTLDGQGADELLAGYDGYPGQRMLSLMEGRRYIAMNRFARSWGAWPGRSYMRAYMYLGRAGFPDTLYQHARKALGRDFQPPWLCTRLLREAGVTFRETRTPLLAACRRRRVIEQLAHSLQVRGLPHLLRHGDRNSMAFSIESRVPFLTTGMAELLLSMPEHYLISDSGETKSVFRAAMRGIVPDAILDRRDKIGLATPEHEWFLRVAPKMRGWLGEGFDIPFINRKTLLASFDAVVEGRAPFSWQAWRWVNYIRWYQNSEASSLLCRSAS